MVETTELADREIEQIVDLYSKFVNPGLASLMKFAGFGDVVQMFG